ncbi:MAG: GNAT family N-acetyltransferase [Saccharospirillum sp.]
MTAAPLFPFRQYDPLVGPELTLTVNRYLEGDRALEGAPAYLFDIRLNDGLPIGQIDLRIGHGHSLVTYAGHIGYGIEPAFRGHYYAAKACQLLVDVALDHDLPDLWITCNPDNLASIKTCQFLGARLIEKVKVPLWSELWRRGDREKLRFLWQLPQSSPLNTYPGHD